MSDALLVCIFLVGVFVGLSIAAFSLVWLYKFSIKQAVKK